MVYALIILILLMVIAPVMAIIPNARQKAQIKQRKQAMGHGIRVELTSIDDPDPDPAKYLSNTGKPLERRLKLVAYRLYRKRAAGEKHYDWQYDRVSPKLGATADSPVFQSIDTNLSLMPDGLKVVINKQLSLFSRDVVRIEEKHNLVTVYWHESGDVDRVIAFLKQVTAKEI